MITIISLVRIKIKRETCKALDTSIVHIILFQQYDPIEVHILYIDIQAYISTYIAYHGNVNHNHHHRDGHSLISRCLGTRVYSRVPQPVSQSSFTSF